MIDLPQTVGKNHAVPQEQDFHKRLLDDLAKSGFAAELKAAEKFKQEGWGVTSSGQFLDPVEHVNREIDIQGWLEGDTEALTHDILVDFEVIAEVKKAQNPWIVFNPSRRLPLIGRSFAKDLLLRCSNLKNSDFISVKIADQTSTGHNCWAGTGLHESFKKPGAPSRWFAAFQKLVRAADLRFGEVQIENKAPPSIFLIHPVLILDGPLFSARIENESIKLSRIAEAGVKFKDSHPNLKHDAVYIDVVTLDGLSSYLGRFAKLNSYVSKKAIPTLDK